MIKYCNYDISHDIISLQDYLCVSFIGLLAKNSGLDGGFEMVTYLVDYENVNKDGLNGVSKLDSSHSVYIFYSEKADSMTFGLHRRLMETKANVDFFRVTVGTKNSLDFQLVSFLGYLIAKHEKETFVIVSKDTGFNSVVDFWSRKKINISRSESITNDKQHVSEILLEKVTDALGPELSKYAQCACKAIQSSSSKTEVNNYIAKNLPQADRQYVGDIYGKIKALISAEVPKEEDPLYHQLKGLVDEQYIEIVSCAIKERKSKSGIHTYLVKELKNQQIATEIYSNIKPLLKDKS